MFTGVWSLGRSLCDMLGRGAETLGCAGKQKGSYQGRCVPIEALALSSFSGLGQVDFDLLI